MNDHLVRALEFALLNPYSDFYRKRLGTRFRSYLQKPLSDFPLLSREQIDAEPLLKRIFIPPSSVAFVRATSGSSGRKVAGFPMAEDPELARLRASEGFLDESRIGRYFGPYLKDRSSRGVLLFSAVGVVHERQLWDVDGVPLVVADPLEPALTARMCAVRKVDAIFMFPSPLISLIPFLRDAGALEHIQLVILVGERITKAQEDALRLAFPHARIVSNYSSTESQGFVAVTCPLRETIAPTLMHTTPAYHLELIDPESHAVVPLVKGSEGEVVLTTFLPCAFPLIRYRTGDLAAVREDGICPCGSGQPLIELLGRAALDLVKIPRGGISVAALESAVQALPISIEDFSATWHEGSSPRFLSVEVFSQEVPARDLSAEFAQALEVGATIRYADVVALGDVGPVRVVVRPLSELSRAIGKRKRLRAHP